MKEQQFYEACSTILNHEDHNVGIGTLGEKSLHAILKYYFEPDSSYHEIRYHGFVADIAYEDQVIEIQTRGFNKMRRKLSVFLNEGKVRIVYPIAYEKWIEWIDEETGSITNKRKSPKRGTPYECFYELYKIKPYLLHPNLQFSIILVNVEEQRLLNGWSQNRKRGSSRFERIPTKLIDQIDIDSVEDYRKLIPEGLEEPFSTKDYKAATRLSLSVSQTALHVLNYVGAVEKVGKRGNLILYKRKDREND